MTPDNALTVALKALGDAKIRMFEDYKIVMTRPESKSNWSVRFVALPETPGMDVFVNVANDASSSILQGP